MIGGGPAGAATALHLARQRLRVVLIERRVFGQPHNDALRSGEGLIPATIRELAVLGIAAQVAPWALNTVHQLRLIWPNCATTTNDLRVRGGIVQVDREQLDHALFRAALAAGADARQGWRARALHRDERGRVTGVVVQTPGGAPRLIRAPMVVDAGGRSALSLREQPAALDEAGDDFLAVCLFFERVAGLEPGVWEMHLLRGGAVFQLSQLRGGLVRCALGAATGEGDDAARHPLALFWDRVRRSPALAARLDAAALVGRPYIRARIGYRVREAAFDGLLLVGDAAGYVNPLFGDGVLRALHSARRAADTIAGALRRGDTSRAGLAPYARYHAACDARDQALRWGLRRLHRALPALNGVGMVSPLRKAFFGALIR